MERLPVIVGVGEVKDQPADRATGQEPAALIEAALRLAEADAGAALLRRLDRLDVVNVVSWPYDDLAGLLADRVAAAPGWRRHGAIGGHTPVQFIHEAAACIARGEADVAAVCGGEASHTATWARRSGTRLDWTSPREGPPQGDGWLPARDRGYIAPLARRHGMTEPITVYPLYEVATQATWGQTPAAGQAESAALWSALSEVAARNPIAWLQNAVSPEAVAAVGPANRLIAWPYPKLMVANPAVNQAAAVLLTSVAVARAAGIPEHRMIHIQTGAAAAEPRDWMARDGLDASPAQDVVLEAMLHAVGGDPAALGLLELYSCFPVVPKMARRTLGLAGSQPVSVVGGLTFHGAPLNTYMTHAAAGMVRQLRDGAGPGRGLLYGQGGHLTSHHALLLGREPGQRQAPGSGVLAPFDRNADAAARRGPPPAIVEDATGPATVETFTVVFRPDGTIQHGVVVARLADGARTLARVPAEDDASLAALMATDRSAVGLVGRLNLTQNDDLRWSHSETGHFDPESSIK